MCLFPTPNTNYSSVAYKKGVREFSCGACPECLQKRSSVWALRSVYEARSHSHNLMVTLTYDSFKNPFRPSLGENPVDPTLKCDKRHIQLFIKRLRKWCDSHNQHNIKYICCAEYGSRTHRAHYHLILFGVNFPDLAYYKKSKRNHAIFMSSTLTRLWSHGICTVDSKNVFSAVARYCTKYCAKDRSTDTFMLCSQNIGIDELYKNFNGYSYYIDGREYSIPRAVWQRYIADKYSCLRNHFDYRYVNHAPEYKVSPDFDDMKYNRSCMKRRFYRLLRDNDPVYISYLDYWQKRASVYEKFKPNRLTRIYLLDDSRYHNYKIAALDCYFKRSERFISYVAPNSNCVSAYHRDIFKLTGYCPRFGHLPLPPRPNTASDTKKYFTNPFTGETFLDFNKYCEKLLTSYVQCDIFDV